MGMANYRIQAKCDRMRQSVCRVLAGAPQSVVCLCSAAKDQGWNVLRKRRMAPPGLRTGIAVQSLCETMVVTCRWRWSLFLFRMWSYADIQK
jgi:hypothetical protein